MKATSPHTRTPSGLPQSSLSLRVALTLSCCLVLVTALTITSNASAQGSHPGSSSTSDALDYAHTYDPSQFPRAHTADELDRIALLVAVRAASRPVVVDPPAARKVTTSAKPAEPARPAVEEGRPQGLERLLIEERKGLKRCVLWSEQHAGPQRGRLGYEITVEADGTVSNIRLVERSVSSELASCLRARALGWSFPAQPKPVRFVHTWIFD